MRRKNRSPLANLRRKIRKDFEKLAWFEGKNDWDHGTTRLHFRHICIAVVGPADSLVRGRHAYAASRVPWFDFKGTFPDIESAQVAVMIALAENVAPKLEAQRGE